MVLNIKHVSKEDMRDVALLLEHRLAEEPKMFIGLFEEIKRDPERLEGVCLGAIAAAYFLLTVRVADDVQRDLLRRLRAGSPFPSEGD